MLKQFLECGKIVTLHGVAGELKVSSWCDTPQELAALPRLFLDGGQTPIEIERARVHKKMVLLKIKGVDTPEQAAALRGKILWLDRDDLQLSQGQHFIQDLLGASVTDADTGETYGVLSDVTQTGANDVYHVTFPDGRVFLVPAIEQVVLNIDTAANTVTIRPLKGLFDDED